MPQIQDVTDAGVRTLLEQAREEMRTGDATRSVQTSVDALKRLWELRPEELAALTDPALTREMPDTVHFPDYGVELDRDDGTAVVRYRRERFSVSEAIAHYEFALGRAVALGV